MNIYIKQSLYKNISNILEKANDKDFDSDSDDWCEECSDAQSDDDHSDECDCCCHDGSSYFEYATKLIVEHLSLTYELVDKNEKSNQP